VTDRPALGDVLVALDLGKPFMSLHRKDGGRQGGLAVVDVADGADVDVNFLHDTNSPVATSNQRVCGPYAQSPWRSFLHDERNQSALSHELPKGRGKTRKRHDRFAI